MSSKIAIMTFDNEEKAGEVMASVKKLQKDNLVDLKDMVVVVKNQKGKIKVTETADFTKGRGVATGGALGFVIGLMIGGPIGGALLGGAAGYLAGKKIDLGVSNDKIKSVTDEMVDGSSAIFIQLGSDKHADIIANLLGNSGGSLYEVDLTDEHEADIDDALADTVMRH